MQKYIPKLLIVLLNCPTYSCFSGSQADIFILSSMTRCWKKVAQTFPKVAQTYPQQFLLENWMFSKCLKSHHTFGLILKETLTQIIIKNHPIWSHWLRLQNDWPKRRTLNWYYVIITDAVKVTTRCLHLTMSLVL